MKIIEVILAHSSCYKVKYNTNDAAKGSLGTYGCGRIFIGHMMAILGRFSMNTRNTPTLQAEITSAINAYRSHLAKL